MKNEKYICISHAPQNLRCFCNSLKKQTVYDLAISGIYKNNNTCYLVTVWGDSNYALISKL